MCPSWILLRRGNSIPKVTNLLIIVMIISSLQPHIHIDLNNVMFIFSCFWALYNGILLYIVFCNLVFSLNIVSKVHTCYLRILLLPLFWVTIYPFSCRAHFDCSLVLFFIIYTILLWIFFLNVSWSKCLNLFRVFYRDVELLDHRVCAS